MTGARPGPENSRKSQEKFLFFNVLNRNRFACETALRTLALPDGRRFSLDPVAEED